MIESRWWAVAYASTSQQIGTMDIQLEEPQSWPVTPGFWAAMLDMVADQKRGALLALTPVTAPFGGVLGGRHINKPY